jgi:acetoin utilization deacetylase AcuC-like enzyme
VALRAFYSDHVVLPLPEGHKFPMAKYSRLRERILAEGIVTPDDLHEAPLAAIEDLRLVHDAGYVDAVLNGTVAPEIQRRIGFPWSPQMVERSRRSVGATIAAAHAALDEGVAANLAGGTHHAFADRGEGFCVFNDVAVAARVLQRDPSTRPGSLRAGQPVRRILIVDLDVHQGNGTAAIFHGDASVFTFSMHGDKNFPFKKEVSDLDVPLADGTGDDEYLSLLEAHLQGVLNRHQPDFVFYLAGADPFEDDRLGRLRMTIDGLKRRDKIVMEACTNARLPVAISMSGGYANDVEAIVTIHANTIRTACSTFVS